MVPSTLRRVRIRTRDCCPNSFEALSHPIFLLGIYINWGRFDTVNRMSSAGRYQDHEAQTRKWTVNFECSGWWGTNSSAWLAWEPSGNKAINRYWRTDYSLTRVERLLQRETLKIKNSSTCAKHCFLSWRKAREDIFLFFQNVIYIWLLHILKILWNWSYENM